MFPPQKYRNWLIRAMHSVMSDLDQMLLECTTELANKRGLVRSANGQKK